MWRVLRNSIIGLSHILRTTWAANKWKSKFEDESALLFMGAIIFPRDSESPERGTTAVNENRRQTEWFSPINKNKSRFVSRLIFRNSRLFIGDSLAFYFGNRDCDSRESHRKFCRTVNPASRPTITLFISGFSPVVLDDLWQIPPEGFPAPHEYRFSLISLFADEISASLVDFCGNYWKASMRADSWVENGRIGRLLVNWNSFFLIFLELILGIAVLGIFRRNSLW